MVLGRGGSCLRLRVVGREAWCDYVLLLIHMKIRITSESPHESECLLYCGLSHAAAVMLDQMKMEDGS